MYHHYDASKGVVYVFMPLKMKFCSLFFYGSTTEITHKIHYMSSQ